MDLRRKNIFYTVVLLLAMLIVYLVRDSDNAEKPKRTAFSGTTMGTIQYNIQYFDPQHRNLKQEVDSLLKVFNASLSTYIPDSEISRFNRDSVFTFRLPFFHQVLEASSKVYDQTGGAFDPTVMPLVNAWGFGPETHDLPDSSAVDSLMQFVGFDLIGFDENKVWKTDPRTSLDFSASAKGQAVDVILDFIAAKGIRDIFVEIGGEVRVKGRNRERDRPWSVAILDPNSTREEINYLSTVELKNGGLATSGNYFNYNVVNGVKYSHTLDPTTGFPIEHPLLSASVFAPTCMEADALATAFMVMGHEKAIAFLNDHPEIMAFLVFSTPDGQLSTYTSAGLSVEMLDTAL